MLADADEGFRTRLRAAVEREAEMEVVGEAADGETVVHLAETLSPDVIVLPVSLAGLNGLQATRRITSANRAAKVLGMTSSGPAIASEVFQAGGMGCLARESACQEVVRAIKAIAGGRVYVSPRIGGAVCTRRLLTAPAPGRAATRDALARAPDGVAFGLDALSLRPRRKEEARA